MQLRTLAPFLVRVVRWQPIPVAALLSGLLIWSQYDAVTSPSHAVWVLRGVALLLAAAVPFGLDDRTRATLAAVPTPLWWRAGLRLGAVLVPAALVWAAALALVVGRVEGSLPATGLTLEAGALLVTVLAVAGGLARWRGVTDPGTVTSPVVVAAGPPPARPAGAGRDGIPSGAGMGRGSSAVGGAARTGRWTARGVPARPRPEPTTASLETMGLVFALTLPGLVVLLLLVAFVDQALLRLRGRGIVPWRRDTPVSSTGFDLLHAALSPGKQHELDQRSSQDWSATTRRRARRRAAGSTSPLVWPACTSRSACEAKPMKVHLVQLAYSDDEPLAERTSRVAALVRAQRGADLVVLPELWPQGGFSYERWEAEAQPLDGSVVEALREAARDIGATVHMGSLVERDEAGRLFNTSVLART